MAIRLNAFKVTILNVVYMIILLLFFVILAGALSSGFDISPLIIGVSVMIILILTSFFFGINMIGEYFKKSNVYFAKDSGRVNRTVKQAAAKSVLDGTGKKEVKENKSDQDERDYMGESIFVKKLSKKYKELPARRDKRLQLQREVAQHIQQAKGSFTLSQILSLMIEIFADESVLDRREILDELKEWVSEDTYTQLVKKEGNVSHYELI